MRHMTPFPMEFPPDDSEQWALVRRLNEDLIRRVADLESEVLALHHDNERLRQLVKFQTEIIP